MVAATAPDLGSPSIITTMATVVGFLCTAYAWSRHESEERIKQKAFVGGSVGAGLGLLFYGFGLVSGLY
jgi:hypothetical protein